MIFFGIMSLLAVIFFMPSVLGLMYGGCEGTWEGADCDGVELTINHQEMKRFSLADANYELYAYISDETIGEKWACVGFGESCEFKQGMHYSKEGEGISSNELNVKFLKINLNPNEEDSFVEVCVSSIAQSQICRDSDGGKNYGEKGITRALDRQSLAVGPEPDGLYGTTRGIDCCEGKKIHWEYYCNDDQTLGFDRHRCRCEDGVCVNKGFFSWFKCLFSKSC